MDLPRTPSPPPPPPSPPEVLEPMDLSSERPPFHQGSGQSPNHQSHQDTRSDPERNMAPERGMMRQNQVGTAILMGVPIVSLYIDIQERLCLAQISNTLLKAFSYNEIHNRRVALGITCVQCTPVQLEILRRAGAMPISSRRCGMITKREAERLVKSFLEEHAPPKLPDNFAFKVRHTCGWGCSGSFMPSRYNSSRAKCIKCTYCNLFFSPNKFIFHFHRIPEAKYRHPDAANFNSWRRHMDLDYEPVTDDLMHAWEDVKAMFNGGSRKRLVPCRSPSKVEGEKRQRMSIGASNMPKLPPHPSFNMFSANTSVPNMFPQQPPYGQFPMIQNDMESMAGGGRRVCFSDLWRPKNSMSYYNPLSLMWAKNFSLCPPAGQHPTKQDTMRESVLRMPGMFMDMNGNKTAMESSATSRSKPSNAEQNKNKSNSRSSAFRPVGNFAQCPSLSPNMAEFNMPVFPTPSMSTPSEKSDDFSDALADDEDVDVDVEDARDDESDMEHDVLDEFGLSTERDSQMEQARTSQHDHIQEKQNDNQMSSIPKTNHMTHSACVQKRDHVTSFSIESLFDTKRDAAHFKTTHSVTSHAATVASSGGISPKQTSAAQLQDAQEQSSSLGYILNLSKEELQSELMKLMETRENLGNGLSQLSHVGSKSPEGTASYSEPSRA